MLRTNLEIGTGLLVPEGIVLTMSILLSVFCLYLLFVRRKAMTVPMLVSAAAGFGLFLI